MKRLVPFSFFTLFVALFLFGSFPSADAQGEKDPKDTKKTKKDDVKKDEVKKVEAKKEDAKKEDAKKEDAKKEDAKKEDAKKEDAKKEDAKKDAKVDDKKKDDKKEPLKEEPKKEPFVADTPLFELKGHDNWIKALAYSKDGKLLVTAGRDRTVRIWDVASKKEKGVIKGFNDDVHLAISGDKVYVTAGKWNKEKKAYEGEVKILELPSGKEIGKVKAHAEIVEAVGVTPDGKEIVTGSDDATAKVFDAAGKELQTLKGHTGKILGVALSPDGKRAATASADGSMKLWDVATGKDTTTIKKEIEESKVDPKTKKETKTTKVGQPFNCVVFSPDGKKLAAGNQEGEIRLIDAESGNVLNTLKTPEGIWSLAWTSAGDKLASGSIDKTIRIWDASGKEINVIKAHGSDTTLGTVTALAFHPGGQWIASGGLDGLVKVWPVSKK